MFEKEARVTAAIGLRLIVSGIALAIIYPCLIAHGHIVG